MTYVKLNNTFGKNLDGFMNEILNEMPASLGKVVREDVLLFPPVNITEKPDSYHLEMAAPGMEKADFKIQLDNKLLTISSENKEAAKAESDKLVRKEFSYKPFKRSFTLDEKIDANNITAKYEQGILKVDLAKKEEVKSGSKDIAIQ